MKDVVERLRDGLSNGPNTVRTPWGETVEEAANEIELLRTALKCERDSGTCVMVHDPERPPCTAENCNSVRAAHQQRKD